MKRLLISIICLGFMFMVSGVGNSGEVKSVPLTGLSYHGQPSNIPVPAGLPQSFIEDANDLLTDRLYPHQTGVNVIMLVFVGPEAKWTITVWAIPIPDCPKFLALDYYHYETEIVKYYTYTVDQKISKVTGDEYTTFLNGAPIEAYCK